jgi:hypothetical protein
MLLKRSKRKKLVHVQEVKKSRKKAVVAASIALVLVGGAAFAYWTMRGDGIGSASTKADGQALVITQDVPGAIAPGDTIGLNGTIRNPNSTSVRLGTLVPRITSAGGSKMADFKLAGKSITDATIIPGNKTILWSGLTLQYVDSATEAQNDGMNATVSLAYSLSPYAAPASGYNAIPAILPGNVPSVGNEAYAYTEFGDKVGLGGTGRALQSMTVLFSSWGCTSGGWTTKNCVTTAGATFDVPLTFTVYSDNSGTPGTKLAEQTKTVAFDYRPSASSNCQGTDLGKWFNASDNSCNNGKIQTVKMDFAAGVTLPENVIWTVKYNTTHYGPAPIGEAAACYTTGGCGYDSLNVGVESFPNAPFTGTDLDENQVFVNGAMQTGPANDLWTGYRPLASIVTK